MKRLLLLGTGGTIASRATDDGLAPAMRADELLRFLPDGAPQYAVDAVQVCSIDSTNIQPEHWLLMARAIRAQYEAYDGFVIAHGTDTMAYTAAALSYLIQQSPKPIVITGAQKPIGVENSDSRMNLQNSFLYAASGEAAGVSIVFDGRVILGTRARKVRSKSFDAFMSINYPDLARMQDGKLLCYIRPPFAAAPAFYDTLCTRVSLLKLIPGTDAEALAFLFGRSDAVILESYGVGGVPQLGNARYMEIIDSAVQQGKLAVMTTQVQFEGSDIGLYQVGHALKARPGVLEAYDMTTESVVAKLMWILGLTHDPAEVERYFYTPVASDLLFLKEKGTKEL